MSCNVESYLGKHFFRSSMPSFDTSLHGCFRDEKCHQLCRKSRRKKVFERPLKTIHCWGIWRYTV